MASLTGSFRRMACWAFAATLFAGACSTATSRDADDSGPGPGFSDASADRYVVEAGSNGDAGLREAGAPSLNPLCGGPSGACGSPDDVMACSDVSIDAGPPPDLIDAGGGGQLDAGTDASTAVPDAGSDAAIAAPDGGVSSDSAPPESLGDSGIQFGPDLEPPPAEPPGFACQVRSDDGQPVRSCEPAGRGGRGAPCTSSRDCSPGYGCVGEGGAGQCLRYCCEGPDGCDAGTFCADRPLRSGAGSASLLVPVCVPADDCRLDEPHPCQPTETQACTCEPNESCALVRGDGTTSCVVPGDGVDGEACPCAAGYFCVVGMQTCVKVCRTGATNSGECGAAGRCQAAANFPEGFGLCVGMTSASR